jgi:hypothetical protein
VRPGSPRTRVATSLFAATASLLDVRAGPSIAEESERTWQFDTALSWYDEGERVRDASAELRVSRLFRRGLLALRLTVDSLTGASASGAVPSRFAQTFTSPSGNGSYRVDPGETPLDPTFLDTRVALGANWVGAVGRRGEIDVGLSFSDEYDYLHTGLNARYSLGLNQRNTTLAIGLALAADTIDPVGGAPVPLAPMLPEGATGNKLADDSKSVADFLIGVTQVLGRRTIGQLNYSFSRSSGYLTDPYKLLTVVDPVTGDPVAGPDDLHLYRFESRPDERAKHSVFAQVKHAFGRPILDASYRYMTDDWGVDSHTVDLRWRQPIGRSWYLQPHVRLYTQSAADFYRPYLRDGDPLPDSASADYRLGELDTTALGLKVGRPFGRDRQWSARVESYEQSGRAPPGAAVGSLESFDLFPTVSATIVQVGVEF